MSPESGTSPAPQRARRKRQLCIVSPEPSKIECPAGSGKLVTILEASEEISRRLQRLFMRGADGRRAVFGGVEKYQTDPHFRDYVPFHEYFHGDTGRGIGASHQTGWTGLIAKLIHPRRPEG